MPAGEKQRRILLFSFIFNFFFSSVRFFAYLHSVCLNGVPVLLLASFGLSKFGCTNRSIHVNDLTHKHEYYVFTYTQYIVKWVFRDLFFPRPQRFFKCNELNYFPFHQQKTYTAIYGYS